MTWGLGDAWMVCPCRHRQLLVLDRTRRGGFGLGVSVGAGWSGAVGWGLARGVRGVWMWLAAGISFLRFNELLTRARARLELRSGGIHVNFV